MRSELYTCESAGFITNIQVWGDTVRQTSLLTYGFQPLKEISPEWAFPWYNFTFELIANKMKKLIFAICLFGSFLLQGCEAYVEPVGGFYVRENVWYYHDGRGREYHENRRYHHGPDDEHREHDHH